MRAHPITIDYEKLQEARLIGFFLFLTWPILAIIVPFGMVALTALSILDEERYGRRVPLLGFLILLPMHTLTSAWKAGNIKILLAMCLLAPLLVTAVLCVLYPFASLFVNMLPNQIGVPRPPGIFGGGGVLGTSYEGVGILQQIILGSGYTYFSTLIAVFFVLVGGCSLGRLTYNKRIDGLVLGFIEVIESIPFLFTLLVMLAVYSWWQDELKNTGIFSFVFELLRPIVVGLCMGFGFLPRLVRVIREKIMTFGVENFIDATKAHGIDQRRILWFHIIWKNCLSDIILVATQIWAVAILMGISLDYLVSIGPASLGAKLYTNWAQMLIDARGEVLFSNLRNWWIWVFPSFFIISTVVGFYLFGDGLRDFRRERFMDENSQSAYSCFLAKW